MKNFKKTTTVHLIEQLRRLQDISKNLRSRKLFLSFSGFTLIELLVVIAILTILLAITLVAINPQAQFRKANDAKRRSSANSILNAISQWSADNGGNLIAGSGSPIPTATALNVITPFVIARNTVGSSAISSTVDLCNLLAPQYVAQLPVDPGKGATPGIPDTMCLTGYDTGYGISVGNPANARVTVWGLSATPQFSLSR